MVVDSRRVKACNTKPPGKGPVVYVMARDQRVAENWPLYYAASLAREREVPLVVLFVVGPMFQHGTARHNEWMVASLKEVAEDLATLQIPFYVQTGEWSEEVVAFAKEHEVGQVVFDFNPLQPVRVWREAAAANLSVQCEMVDGRNIVPCWFASDKAEFAAHTFRSKVQKLLPEFLEPVPALPQDIVEYEGKKPVIDWKEVAAFRSVDQTIQLPEGFIPGRKEGLKTLQRFLDERLSRYDEARNDPNENVLSSLSPYLRWGNISSNEVVQAVVSRPGTRREDKDAFIEEITVRRELTDNYVWYTEGYDTLAGAHNWAQTTLNAHLDDEREHVYTMKEFETASTHDELWNAMQRQMVTEGKMHGWCRMYWAKKILEWTNTPDYAIEVALTLNDRYELDGRDSNGVVGVMWSIAGVHDRAWTERPVYGKVRYMNFNGAKRKFDVQAYIDRYSTESTLFTDD